MTGSQIVSLIIAVLLFLPGACFSVFGATITAGADASGLLLLGIGVGIFALVFLLVRYAFRKDG